MPDNNNGYGVSALPGSLVDPERYGWEHVHGWGIETPTDRLQTFERDGYLLQYHSDPSTGELQHAQLDHARDHGSDANAVPIQPLELTDALRWPHTVTPQPGDRTNERDHERAAAPAAQLAAQATPTSPTPGAQPTGPAQQPAATHDHSAERTDTPER